MKPIAIVGMSALFPEAEDLGAFWSNVLAMKDCITDVPPTHWDPDDYYDPDPTAPDKTYCKRGGFIPEVEFDPMAFGIPPSILEVTDASQLLALVVARRALEDAGLWGPEARPFNRERTGVILGAGGGGAPRHAPRRPAPAPRLEAGAPAQRALGGGPGAGPRPARRRLRRVAGERLPRHPRQRHRRPHLQPVRSRRDELHRRRRPAPPPSARSRWPSPSSTTAAPTSCSPAASTPTTPTSPTSASPRRRPSPAPAAPAPSTPRPTG